MKTSFREYINRRREEFLTEETSDNRFSQEEHEAATKSLASLKTVPKEQVFFKNPDKEEVFLKDVGFRDHGRVYHLNNSEKNLARRVRIEIEHIGKSQPTAQREGIQRAIDLSLESDSDRSEKVPFVIKEDGVYYVQDGHHRVSAHLLAGRPTMIVDMVEKRGDHFYTPTKEPRWQDR